MLLEIALWHRSFSGLTLLGMGLVMLPTAWTLLRSAAHTPPVEQPLPLKKAA
jgi:hypothetical protein